MMIFQSVLLVILRMEVSAACVEGIPIKTEAGNTTDCSEDAACDGRTTVSDDTHTKCS